MSTNLRSGPTETEIWWAQEKEKRRIRAFKRVLACNDVAVTRKYNLRKRFRETDHALELRKDIERLEQRLISYQEDNDEYHINIIEKMLHGKKVLLHHELKRNCSWL